MHYTLTLTDDTAFFLHLAPMNQSSGTVDFNFSQLPNI